MNKGRGISAVGISSLIVIFAVLCLTVFALLSVSTVQAAQRLAQESDEAILGYYEADAAAEQILAQLRAGKSVQGVQQEGDVYSYSCPISDTQSLAVQVKIQGAAYEILHWQVVSRGQWEADNDLPVWDGKLP